NGNETSSKLSTTSARTCSGRIAKAGSSPTSSFVSTVSGTLMPDHSVTKLAPHSAGGEDIGRTAHELRVGCTGGGLRPELQQQVPDRTLERADQLTRARAYERGPQLGLRIFEIE